MNNYCILISTALGQTDKPVWHAYLRFQTSKGNLQQTINQTQLLIMFCPSTKPIYVQSIFYWFSYNAPVIKMMIGLRFALNFPWNSTMNILYVQLMSQIEWSINMLTLFLPIVFQRKCKTEMKCHNMYVQPSEFLQKCSLDCYNAKYHTYSSSLHLVCQLQRQFSNNSNNSKWYKS